MDDSHPPITLLPIDYAPACVAKAAGEEIVLATNGAMFGSLPTCQPISVVAYDNDDHVIWRSINRRRSRVRNVHGDGEA